MEYRKKGTETKTKTKKKPTVIFKQGRKIKRLTLH